MEPAQPVADRSQRDTGGGRQLALRGAAVAVQRREQRGERAAEILRRGSTSGALELTWLRGGVRNAGTCRTKGGIDGMGPRDVEDITAGNFGFLLVLIE